MITRKTNNVGIELIKHFESFSAKPYRCPGGYLTVGYGHKLKEGENINSLTQWEAEQLLLKDIENAELAVSNYVRGDISDNQFSSLVSFTYNVGGSALQRSTLRQKINYGNSLEDICVEFMKWVFAGGKKMKGLYYRRYAESVVFYNS